MSTQYPESLKTYQKNNNFAFKSSIKLGENLYQDSQHHGVTAIIIYSAINEWQHQLIDTKNNIFTDDLIKLLYKVCQTQRSNMTPIQWIEKYSGILREYYQELYTQSIDPKLQSSHAQCHTYPMISTAIH